MKGEAANVLGRNPHVFGQVVLLEVQLVRPVAPPDTLVVLLRREALDCLEHVRVVLVDVVVVEHACHHSEQTVNIKQ